MYLLEVIVPSALTHTESSGVWSNHQLLWRKDRARVLKSLQFFSGVTVACACTFPEWQSSRPFSALNKGDEIPLAAANLELTERAAIQVSLYLL